MGPPGSAPVVPRRFAVLPHFGTDERHVGRSDEAETERRVETGEGFCGVGGAGTWCSGGSGGGGGGGDTGWDDVRWGRVDCSTVGWGKKEGRREGGSE